VLLLLHGLGGTSSVWDGVTAGLDVPWVAPDLPGHGAAPPLSAYTFDGLARAVAEQLDPAQSYDVLGHSLGGVVGLVLAGGLLQVRRVVGLGIKVVWSDDDLGRAAALAAKPQKLFATREEAVARHLAVAGLRGLVPDDAPAASTGVREVEGGWGLALDQRAFGVGRPDLPGLLERCRAEVLLARGEHDPMVSDDDLAALGAPHRTLPGLGHSAHVEDPPAVRALLESAPGQGR
jgi:pimeloyl-ACP methyl ester carboxylesterase